MIIRDATFDDIEYLLKLDYKYFPKEWHVESAFTEAVMSKNRYCYRLIESEGKVKGYHLVIPLKKEAFDSLMIGAISEEEMVFHVQPSETEHHLCLYMGSMVIDTNDSRYLTYFRHLLADFFQTLYHYQEKKADIQEVGAITITKKGKNLCEKLGFQLFSRDGDVNIYKASPEEILKRNARFYMHT